MGPLELLHDGRAGLLHHHATPANGRHSRTCHLVRTGCAFRSVGLLREPGRQDVCERLQKRLEAGIAVVLVQLDHLHDQVVDGRRDLGTDFTRLARRTLETFLDDGDGIVAFERGDARKRVVKRGAERIHVRPEVDGVLLDLLGGDVIGCAPNLVGILLHGGKAEVDELRVPVRVEQDVLGFDVAVHHTLVGGAL